MKKFLIWGWLMPFIIVGVLTIVLYGIGYEMMGMLIPNVISMYLGHAIEIISSGIFIYYSEQFLKAGQGSALALKLLIGYQILMIILCIVGIIGFLMV